MTDLASLALPQLQRMANDPHNAVLRPALERRIAELRAQEEVSGLPNEAAMPAPAPVKRRGVPNGVEQRYAREVLDPLIASGHVLQYEFEAITLHVHDIGKYTADYVCWLTDGGMWMHEVKGRKVHEASVVRVKLHAERRPWIRFTIACRRNKQWHTRYDSLKRETLT